MRSLIVAAGLVLMLTGAAHADTLGVIKENTLVLTDSKGAATAFLLAGDGTFEQSTSKEARPASGACATPASSAGRPRAWCVPAFPADKAVGDEWEIKGPTGKVTYTATIVEGRVKLNAGE